MKFFILVLAAQCSASKAPLRIYGGADAKPDEFSYVVRIEINRIFRFKNYTMGARNDHICSASALSPIWVLSASHCVSEDLGMFHYGRPFTVQKLVIRYGHVEHSPLIKDSFSDVLFTVTHQRYSPLSFESYNFVARPTNDICLVKTSPMNIQRYIKLSALDFKSLYGHEAILAGFGVTTKNLPEGKIITGLTLNLKKPLQVLNTLVTKCASVEILDPIFCLAPRCGDVAMACGGDSGGPLIHPSGVIGVLSSGESSGFCLDPTPKVRAERVAFIIPVSPYIEWIYSYINS